MKARIKPEQYGKLMEDFKKQDIKRKKDLALNSFLLGAHTAMNIAADRYRDDILKATTFEELQPVVLDLLAYLMEREQGLKDVTRSAEQQANQDILAPTT